MKRTLHDIRLHMEYNGCDNETALEMCDEIERLRAALHSIIDLDHHNHGSEGRATTLARAALIDQ